MTYGQRLLELLLRADAAERRRLILAMTPEQLLQLDGAFELWAHKSQLPPPGEFWRVWLMMAGRGFGKTRAGAEWVHGIAGEKPGVHIALVGATIADARSVMVEGVSGVLSVARNRRRSVDWEPSLGRLRWPNGSEAQVFSGDNADGIRGPEHDLAWADELAKWREAEEAWMNLQMGLPAGAEAARAGHHHPKAAGDSAADAGGPMDGDHRRANQRQRQPG